MIIAVTGYIGTGKSTVSKIFEQFGFKRLDVDKLGHELLKDKSIKDSIIAEFGMDILNRDLEIDRNKLREKVFGEDVKIKQLDSIIHPKLEKKLKELIKESKEDLIIDLALYKELNLEESCQKVILIRSETENVYNRLNQKYSKQEILKIMNSQEIITNPDFTIENNSNPEFLESQVEEVIKKLNA